MPCGKCVEKVLEMNPATVAKKAVVTRNPANLEASRVPTKFGSTKPSFCCFSKEGPAQVQMFQTMMFQSGRPASTRGSLASPAASRGPFPADLRLATADPVLPSSAKVWSTLTHATL